MNSLTTIFNLLFLCINALKNVRITIYGNSICDEVLTITKNYESQICAGDIAGYKDTCQGKFKQGNNKINTLTF